MWTWSAVIDQLQKFERQHAVAGREPRAVAIPYDLGDFCDDFSMCVRVSIRPIFDKPQTIADVEVPIGAA